MEDGTNQTPPNSYPPQRPLPPESPVAPPTPTNNNFSAGPMTPVAPAVPNIPAPVITPTAPKWWQRPRVKLIAIIAGALLLLGGGSAAAYFAVIVPNQPANVLKKSLQNTLQQDKITAKGTMDFSGTEEGSQVFGTGGMKGSLDYTLQADGTSDNSSLEAKLKFNNKSFPIELRSVDKTAYLKLGDISDLLGGLNLSSPEFQQIVDTVSKAVSNQWISFKDNAASKTLNCLGTFPDAKQSKEEFTFLEETFKNNQFAKVTSTSKEKVDGKNAIKYVISFDKGKSKDFMERVKERPRYKELLKCLGAEEENAVRANKQELSTVRSLVGLKAASAKSQPSRGGSSSSSNSDDTDIGLQLWVDSSKKVISKIQLDASSSSGKTVVTTKLEYGQTKIEKPGSSKTVEELLKEIGPTLEQIAPGIDSWLSGTLSSQPSTDDGTTGSISARTRNTERQTDIKAIHGQLEAFSAQKGYYPTLANLNDPNWRSTNMKGLDQDALKDPGGTSAILVATPAKNAYSYQAKNSKGGVCTNQVGNECDTYTLTATYEGQVNGQSTFVKNNL